MKKNLILTVASSFMVMGCDNGVLVEKTTNAECSRVNIVCGSVTPFADETGSRSGESTQLSEGCTAELYASGGFTAESVVITYDGEGWTSEEDLRWTKRQDAEVTAYSPPLEELYDEGQLTDLLVCMTTAGYGSDVELSFEHAFAQITFSVEESLNESLAEISLMPSLRVSEIDAWSGDVECTENETEAVTYERDESGEYSLMVPPGEEMTVTISISLNDGTTLTAVTEGNTLEAGKRYGCAIEKEAEQPGIYTAEDFIAFSCLINGTEHDGRSLDEFGTTEEGVTTYYLMNDISLSEEQSAEVSVIGESADTAFEDIFDGQGHCISGLDVEDLELSAGSNYGLFGQVGKAGVVRDLTLRNATMTATGSSKISNIALLCAVNSGVIDGCRIDSCSLSTSQCELVGGMVGNNKGTIVNCCSVESAVVNSYSGSDTPTAAGLVGSSQGEIINCYVALCKLTASYTAGICCQTTSSTNSMTNVYAYKITRYNSTSHAGLVYFNTGTSYTWCFSGSSSQLGSQSDAEGTYKHTQADGELPKYDGTELYVYFNEWIEANPDYSEDYEVSLWEANDLTEPFVFSLE